MTSKTMKMAAACLLAGSIMGSQAPAIAGSDHSSDTWSGDYTGGSLPTGTFLALQYAGFAHSDAFIDPSGNQVPNSHSTFLEEYQRFVYFSQLGGHPFVLQAALPFQNLTDVNVPTLPNNQVGEGFADPVLFFSYFFISDAKTQRWLGFTDYNYLPLGNYDNTKALNLAPDHQYTNVPEIGYTEGLAKFSPSLKGVFFDFVGNASFHTDGNNPINFGIPVPLSPIGPVVPGSLTYDKLTQTPSYDVKAFLRYEPSTFTFVSLGIEKSWGGEQTVTNGRVIALGGAVVVPQGPLALSEDDYLRGHIQFQFPLARDFTIGGDIFHDFQSVGGFREDIGAEIRLTKFFFPAPPPASGPMYTK